MNMKNCNRKGIALILVLSMLMTLFAGLSVTVSAAGNATEVYYCGQKLDATNKYLLVTSNTGSAPVPLASATDTADGYVLLAEFDATKGTLTYKHGYNSELSWNTQVSVVKHEDGIFYGIKANGDLTIELGDYNNFLYLAWRDPSGTTMRAIDVDGNLTINGGSGILKMTATPALDTDGTTEYTSYGIKASGDVNLNGGTLHFYEAHYTDGQTSLKANSKVVYIDADGDINVKGATIKMRAQKSTPNNAIVHFGKEPIVANGYTKSDDSTIDIDGSAKSLGTEGTTTGNLNNLSLTPPEGGIEGGDGDDSTDDDEANLPTPEARPNATEVYYCGVKLDSTNKYLMVENTEKGARVPFASSTDTVNGYTLLAEFDTKTATLTYKSGFDSALSWNTQMLMTQLETDGMYYGIKANGNLTIDIGKYNIFLYVDWRTPSGVEMRAIDVDGKLTINGTRGTLKMTASPALNTDGTTSYTSYGIRAYGDVKLNGGTLHFYEAHYTDGQTSLKANSKVVNISAGGGNIYVDGATIKMRAQKSTPNNAIVHFGKEPIVAEGYTKSDDSTIDIGGDAKSLGTESTTTDNKNNLSLIAPEKETGENIVDGPATELFYCGAKLDAKNPYLLINSSTRTVMASSKKAAEGHELYAVFENGKLIYQRGFSEELLWNTQVEMVQCEDDDIYRGIKSNGDLIIDVGSYHNFLYLNWRYPKGAPLYAIDVQGDLSIIGTTGTLKICATPTLNTASGTTFTSYGIKASGDVRLNGGKIFIYEGHYTPDAVNTGSTTTYVSAGGNIYVDGAEIKMMARKSTPGITHFNKEPIIAEGYTESAYENYEIGKKSGEDSDTSSVGGEAPTTGNKNNLLLTPPERLKLIVGGAYIYKDKPYLVKDINGWKESDTETDAYAVYDEEKQTLTFTKDAELKASMDMLAGEQEGTNLYAYSCILANFDLEVIIPEGIKVTLNADNTTGIERALWTKGNVKVSGGGMLDAYAGPSKNDGNYMSAAIWADGKVSIDGVTATLHTVKAEADGKSGHVIYGKNGIEVSGGATVYAGTDLGKLCNAAPVIYAEADVMMAAESTGDYNAPVAKSELIPFDASRVTSMRYLQISPKKMLPESVGGYGENGKLSLFNPVVEYVFNYEIASGVAMENIIVSGGAAVESVTADGKVLKVTLKNVSAGGKYTIEISGIANSMGVAYSGKNTIEVSNIDIEAVTLNGSENGSVINGDNTAAVTITTQSTRNVMVVATVWSQGTYGKKLKAAKSVAESVSGTQTITIDGLSAEEGDAIEVMVWNGAATRNVLRKSAKFSN